MIGESTMDSTLHVPQGLFNIHVVFDYSLVLPFEVSYRTLGIHLAISKFLVSRLQPGFFLLVCSVRMYVLLRAMPLID